MSTLNEYRLSHTAHPYFTEFQIILYVYVFRVRPFYSRRTKCERTILSDKNIAQDRTIGSGVRTVPRKSTNRFILYNFVTFVGTKLSIACDKLYYDRVRLQNLSFWNTTSLAFRVYFRERLRNHMNFVGTVCRVFNNFVIFANPRAETASVRGQHHRLAL